MFDYQGLLVDKTFKGLPSRLISEITTRAGILMDSRATAGLRGKKEGKEEGTSKHMGV